MAPAALPRVGGPLHLPLRERSTWSSESGPTAAAPRKGAANGRQERAGRERGACAGSEVSPGWWPARPEPAPRTVRSLAAGPLRSAPPGPAAGIGGAGERRSGGAAAWAGGGQRGASRPGLRHRALPSRGWLQRALLGLGGDPAWALRRSRRRSASASPVLVQ